MLRGWFVMLAVLCWPGMVCAAAVERLPVPDTLAQVRAERMVREVFQREYGQTSPEQRRDLGRKLFQQAQQTLDDPAGRYVLLREARDMAASAGDAATGQRAIREMCRQYAVEPGEMMLAMLMAAHRVARAPDALAEIARVALQAAEDSVPADDYERAGQFLALADTAARQAKDLSLIHRAAGRTRELTAIAAEFAQLKAAQAALEKNADDAQASLLVGRFLCTIRNDWDKGLAHLARGADPSLASLAQFDLSGPVDAGRRFELANGWWDVSVRQGELARRNIQHRAGMWYRQAMPGLSGLNLAVAGKRLEEIESAALREQNLGPGLRAELFKGIGLAERAGLRVDPQIDFDWGEESADPALPKDNFSIRWTGLLRPPAAGNYELVIIANTGVRIWLDGKLLADEPNLTRSRNGKRIPVELREPLHPIRIEFWDTSGIAKMQLHWLTPGSEKPEAVPAGALYHELGQE